MANSYSGTNSAMGANTFKGDTALDGGNTYDDGANTYEGVSGVTGVNSYLDPARAAMAQKAQQSVQLPSGVSQASNSNIDPEILKYLSQSGLMQGNGNYYYNGGFDPSQVHWGNQVTLQDSLRNEYLNKYSPTQKDFWEEYKYTPEDIEASKRQVMGESLGSYDTVTDPYRPKDLKYYDRSQNPDYWLNGNPKMIDPSSGFRMVSDYKPAWQEEGGSYSNNPAQQAKYEQLIHGYDFGGQNYHNIDEANAAREAQLQSYLGGTKAQQSEYLSQLLTQGGITGTHAGERGDFGGNQIADLITGDMVRKFGSRDLLKGDDTLYGTVLDMGGFDPLSTQWNDGVTNDVYRGKWTDVYNTRLDQGASNLYRGINDPEWWKTHAVGGGNGQAFLSADDLQNNPGFSSIDNYIRDHGVFSKNVDNGRVKNTSTAVTLGNILGTYFTGVPIGSLVSAGIGYTSGNSDQGNAALKQAAISYALSGVGDYVVDAGVGGAPVDIAAGSSNLASSAGGVFGTGVDLGSTFANQAAQSAIINSAGTALQGGDIRDVAASGIGGLAGGMTEGLLPTSSMSPLEKAVANAAMRSGLAGVGAVISGGDPAQGALSSLAGSAINAGGNAVGSVIDNKSIGNTLGGVGSSLARNEMNKQQAKKRMKR